MIGMGRAFTVIVMDEESLQTPWARRYFTVVVLAEFPQTAPSCVTEATAALLLVQKPPDGELLSTMESPAHTAEGPTIGETDGKFITVR
jgi:hypothetical protein